VVPVPFLSSKTGDTSNLDPVLHGKGNTMQGTPSMPPSKFLIRRFRGCSRLLCCQMKYGIQLGINGMDTIQVSLRHLHRRELFLSNGFTELGSGSVENIRHRAISRQRDHILNRPDEEQTLSCLFSVLWNRSGSHDGNVDMTVPRQPVPQTPKKPRRRKNRSWPLVVSLAGFALTLCLWYLAEFVAEHTVLTTLFAYAPPLLLALPTVLLLLFTLILRDKLALLVNLASGLFVLFVALGFAVPLGPTPAPSAPHLRLMTYNIEHGEEGLGKLVKQIRLENPDVLCCQECNGYNQYSDPLPVLEVSLPDYHFTRADETVIATRLPSHGEETIPLLTADGRVLVKTEVEVQGKAVTILSAHLMTAASPQSLAKHNGSIPDYLRLTAHVRGEQVERILTTVNGISTPTILCGDFNTPPRGIYYRRLTEYFTDAFATRGFGFGWTFPSNAPCLSIDHIFTRQGAHTIRVFVPVTQASDHRPVVADIAIENPTQ
jgi:vancomycin resistance protein VanJ